MRNRFLWVFLIISQLSCETMLSESSSSRMTSSQELDVLSSNKTVIPIPGKLQVLRDSFFFFFPNSHQGFFLYPRTDLQLFKTHFFIQLKASDIVTCGVIEKNNVKKKLIIRAELLKSYHGDVSGIASFCSGQGASLYYDDGKGTTTINTTPFQRTAIITKSTPRLIFPYIPYFVSSLENIASPGNSKIKILVKIEFFDRISNSTLTNCTYYKIDDQQGTHCYGVPVIYPETAFYGEKYKMKQLQPIKAIAEYLESSSEA